MFANFGIGIKKFGMEKFDVELTKKNHAWYNYSNYIDVVSMIPTNFNAISNSSEPFSTWPSRQHLERRSLKQITYKPLVPGIKDC